MSKDYKFVKFEGPTGAVSKYKDMLEALAKRPGDALVLVDFKTNQVPGLTYAGNKMGYKLGTYKRKEGGYYIIIKPQEKNKANHE